jgi:hypothetical protein
LLKPFIFDGLWTVVAMLLWLRLDQAGVRWPIRVLGYLGLGLLIVAAVSTVLVLGPLLALGLVRAARGSRRQLLAQLGLSTLTLMVAAVHLVVFIAPQRRVLAAPYWVEYFVPLDGGVAPALRFAWQHLTSYLPELTSSTYLPPDVDDPLWQQATKTPPPPSLGLLLSAALLAALVAGTATCLRSRDGRALLTAVSGALAGQLAGSLLHNWPFGWYGSTSSCSRCCMSSQPSAPPDWWPPSGRRAPPCHAGPPCRWRCWSRRASPSGAAMVPATSPASPSLGTPLGWPARSAPPSP